MRRRARLARGGDRRSSLSLVKKLLLSFLVVGLLSTVTYQRVYAVLSAQTSNLNASVASGSLTLGDTVYANGGSSLTAGSACPSNWAWSSDNNTYCSTLSWDPSTGLRWPGQTVKAYVALQNTGSLRAAELQLSMPSCTTTNTTGAPAWVFAGTGGNGDACAGGFEMYVQEVNDFSSTSPTDTQCVFPENVYSAPVTDCSWVQDTVAGLNGITCWDLGPMDANATRYFVIGMRWDPVASNSLQGRMPAFSLRWHLDGGNLTYDNTGQPAGTSCANPGASGVGR